MLLALRSLYESGETTETITVDKADLALTGKTVGVVDLEAVAKSDLTLTGKSVAEVGTVAVGKADLALAGQTVTVTDAQIITVDAASLALSGQSVSVLDTEVIGAAALTLTSGTVDIPADTEPQADDTGISHVLTGGSFTRKRWRELQEQMRRERSAGAKVTRAEARRAARLAAVIEATTDDEEDEAIMLLLAA